MVEEQIIVYAPQWNNMTVDNVTFQTNNVVGNFNYPPNVQAYKKIMKFLFNYPLKQAFIKCPLVLYQSYVREFWSTDVAYDPSPPTDKTEQLPLREYLIKFLVLNGQQPLTLDFNTFCSLTGLDYKNGKYVGHPESDVVLGGNYSSIEQVNSIQQLLAYCLITRTEVDIGQIIYRDLVTKILNKSRLKYVSYPRFISCALQVLLGYDYTKDKNLGKTPDPKDPEKNKQLTGMGLPLTSLDEGTHKSKLLPKGTKSDPKDSVGNIQPIDTGLSSTVLSSGDEYQTIDFASLKITVEALHDISNKKDAKLVNWAKSSTNMARNMGSRLSKIELSHTALKTDIFAIKQDTSDIKSMMIEIFNAFKGQPFPTLTSSVTLTLALTYILANVKGENEANTATEDPPSHTEGETDAMDTENKQE
ncbi:hypothetical protein Tco_0207057 [Tanacetum coccineum]